MLKHPSQSLLRKSALALALTLAATAPYAQTLGAQIGAKVDAAGTALSDTNITAKVKSRIATDANLEGSKISVTTDKGVAILTGTATSASAALAAEKLAASTEGVTRVDNRIVTPATSTEVGASASANTEAGTTLGEKVGGTVSAIGSSVSGAAKTTSRVVSDSWITTKVKSELLADTATKGTKISVKTKRHVVYLSGTAGSQAEKDEAIELASRIEGVKSVSATRLKVKAEANATAN